jgi:proline iminopeptidase
MAQEESVPTDGARLVAEHTGFGPPVLLLHGGPGLWDNTRPIADLVTDRVTVYRFDQRGCGRSTGGPPFSLDRAVADVDAVRRHFRLDRPVVAGHSWGASLALAYSLAHPSEVRGLVYLSGVGTAPDWESAFRDRRRAIMPPAEYERLDRLWNEYATAAPADAPRVYREIANLSWPFDFADLRVGRAQVDAMVPPGASINLAAARALTAEAHQRLVGPEFEARLAAHGVPTLVIHGREDPRPYRSAERFARALPHARFQLVDGAGHFVVMEAPQRLRTILWEFLDDVFEDEED